MPPENEARPVLAIAICEAVVLSLVETGALDAEELRGALEDARDSCIEAYPAAAEEIRRHVDEIVRQTYAAST